MVMSSVSDAAESGAAERNNLLFDHFVFEERVHRDSLELGRRIVHGESFKIRSLRHASKIVLTVFDHGPAHGF